MALVKSISLPTGVTAEYFRMVAFSWDRSTREASAHFALFKDAATAANGQPLVPVVAKLRLSAGKFDEYLSTGAMAAASGDVVAQLYLAAKAICAAYAVDPDTEQGTGYLVSDYGRDLFDDAEDA